MQLCRYVESFCFDEDTTMTFHNPLVKLAPKMMIFSCQINSTISRIKYDKEHFQCIDENATEHDLGTYESLDDNKINIETLSRTKTFKETNTEFHWEVKYSFKYFNQLTFDEQGFNVQNDTKLYSKHFKDFIICRWPEDVQVMKDRSSSQYVIMFYKDSLLLLELVRQKQHYWEFDIESIEINPSAEQDSPDWTECPKKLINNFLSPLFVPKTYLKLSYYSDCTIRPPTHTNPIEFDIFQITFITFTVCLIFSWIVSTTINYFTLKKVPKHPREKNWFPNYLTKATAMAHICSTLESHNHIVDEQLFMINEKMYRIAQVEGQSTVVEVLEYEYVEFE